MGARRDLPDMAITRNLADRAVEIARLPRGDVIAAMGRHADARGQSESSSGRSSSLGIAPMSGGEGRVARSAPPSTRDIGHMFESFHQSVQGDFKPAFYNPFRIKRRRRTTAEQFAVLEAAYASDPKPLAPERAALAAQLDMTPRAVQIWFQNRRAKARHGERGSAPSCGAERRHSMPHMAAAVPAVSDLPFRELQEAIFGPGAVVGGAAVSGSAPSVAPAVATPRIESSGAATRKRRAERTRALQMDEMFAPSPSGVPRAFGADMDAFLVPVGAPGVKAHHPASLSVMLCPGPVSAQSGLPAEYFSSPFGELGPGALMYGLPGDGPLLLGAAGFRVVPPGGAAGRESRASSPGAPAGPLLGDDGGLESGRMRPDGASVF